MNKERSLATHTAARRRSSYTAAGGERYWAAGLLAGLAGGALMAVLEMAVWARAGQGGWLPLKSVAAAVFGVDALIGGTPIIAAGLALHLSVAMLWGTLFAGLIGDSTAGRALLFGIPYGAAVWAFMNFVVLPPLDPTMEARVALLPGSWFVFHLVYGATLSLTPVLAPRRPAPRSTVGL